MQLWLERVAAWWQRARTTRREELLELVLEKQTEQAELYRREAERLRDENRSLVNSILARSGFAPIERPADRKQVDVARKRSWPQQQRHLANLQRERLRDAVKLAREQSNNGAADAGS